MDDTPIYNCSDCVYCNRSGTTLVCTETYIKPLPIIRRCDKYKYLMEDENL